MYLLTDVIPLIVQNYFLLFLDPEFLLLMAVVIVLVATQYRRSESVRASMFGVEPRRFWGDTLTATLFGLVGGLVGSIVIILTGLPLTGSGTVFILFLAIAAVLMMINPRFICFAYAGGIISFINIITGWPPVNIFQVLALVALLHMVESLLIFFSGHLGAVPTFFGDHAGRVVGGFTLQKFWPIPLVAMTVAGYPEALGVFSEMPEWWPLIKAGPVEQPFYVGYALVSVVAGLGYGDLAIARNPREKSKLSALYLALYSIALFVLAVAAQYYPYLVPVAVLFSPLGHELVIYIGKRIELSGRPAFIPSNLGVRVLDVIPESTAWKMGIRSGDVLTTVGGKTVYDQWGLKYALEHAAGPLEIEFLQGPGRVYRRGLAFRPDTRDSIGILVVPSLNERSYVEIHSRGQLSGFITKLWGKIRR